ncbi:TPA: FkbM family methyltransferase [Vibrio diabolicus]
MTKIDFYKLGHWEHCLDAYKFWDTKILLPRYVIGKNAQSLDINNIIPLTGIVDDYSNSLTWNGIPIIHSSQVPVESLVVNCSTSVSPVSVERNFSDREWRLLSLNSVIKASGGVLALPTFSREMWQIVEYSSDKLNHIYCNLADDESKHVFLDTIAYRLYLQTSSMKSYKVRISEQYFEDFMEFNNDVFIDAGGFDGDTSEEFAIRYPDYKKIYLIEPSSKNMKDAKQRLKNFSRIEFIQRAVSDRYQELTFDEDSGSASNVNDAGAIKVIAEPIDDLIAEKTSFIKMDLEGWEAQALIGARNIIKKHKPKLAIAVYHSSEDYITLYDYIMNIHPDYKVYMRHYTEGWSETIMFFKS